MTSSKLVEALRLLDGVLRLLVPLLEVPQRLVPLLQVVIELPRGNDAHVELPQALPLGLLRLHDLVSIFE